MEITLEKFKEMLVPVFRFKNSVSVDEPFTFVARSELFLVCHQDNFLDANTGIVLLVSQNFSHYLNKRANKFEFT